MVSVSTHLRESSGKQIASDIIDDVPEFLDNTFPEWKGVEGEEQLYEVIQNDEMQFKGFIDAVILSKDKRGKNKIWLLDWKTAGWGWRPQKKNKTLITRCS